MNIPKNRGELRLRSDNSEIKFIEFQDYDAIKYFAAANKEILLINDKRNINQVNDDESSGRTGRKYQVDRDGKIKLDMLRLVEIIQDYPSLWNKSKREFISQVKNNDWLHVWSRFYPSWPVFTLKYRNELSIISKQRWKNNRDDSIKKLSGNGLDALKDSKYSALYQILHESHENQLEKYMKIYLNSEIKQAQTEIDPMKLIKLVKDRPPLYYTKDEQYDNFYMRDKLWMEVALSLKPKFSNGPYEKTWRDIVIKSWISLCDCYRGFSSDPFPSAYQFATNMTFMKVHFPPGEHNDRVPYHLIVHSSNSSISLNLEIDDLKLIALVKEYPHLWNQDASTLTSKEEKELSWNNIAMRLLKYWHILSQEDKFPTLLFLKNRWKLLSDEYYMLSKYKEKGRQYKYKDALSFLSKDAHVSIACEISPEQAQSSLRRSNRLKNVRPTQSGSIDDFSTSSIADVDESLTAVKVEPIFMEQCLDINELTITTPGQDLYGPSNGTELYNPLQIADQLMQTNDTDIQFLLSLANDYKSLSYGQKLDFKINVLQFFKIARATTNKNNGN